eukprot:CAMPEP_0204137914 /NCGR_PEP_ID=MMETSP0361-20130328/17688_1 /ASSEMBLY_ACC=CAM_ASM_000343 /TAXON_ID=268821 /ORGANISM="Scrippsiella Hangoei, Strain SHTV-5" /LENGTH=185 /DNA_ID=CAMNT_0051091667 /DNA_START=148 /DNA_END=702 /DNA_ORIENTATION=+
MTGLNAASGFALKCIADLEHDLTNATDFLASMKLSGKVEVVFIAINFLACLPFLGNWWMVPPQFLWVAFKAFRMVTGADGITEKDAYQKNIYLKHRKIHTMSLFFYLISWFIYFARAMTAVMDIHVTASPPMIEVLLTEPVLGAKPAFRSAHTVQIRWSPGRLIHPAAQLQSKRGHRGLARGGGR